MNQFGSGSHFGWFLKGRFYESVWVCIAFRVILKRALLRISLGLDRISGAFKNQFGSVSDFEWFLKGRFYESVWVCIAFRVILKRALLWISLGLDRISSDSSKGAFMNQRWFGAFMNQFGSGSHFGWFLKGRFYESVWVCIAFRVILKRALLWISLGLDRISMILKRALLRISLGLDRISGDS